jgi:hypothetical protein
MRGRTIKAAAILALLVTVLGAQATLAYNIKGGVRTTNSNTTKYFYWSYPRAGTPDCPTNDYDLRAAVSMGAVTSQYVYIKSVTWRYTVDPDSSDLTMWRLWAQDNNHQVVRDYADPRPVMWAGQVTSFTLTLNQRFYWLGGYVLLGANAVGPDCASWSRLDLYFVPGTPT